MDAAFTPAADFALDAQRHGGEIGEGLEHRELRVDLLREGMRNFDVDCTH